MADAHSSGWRPRTRAVRGGLCRSEHGETAEALYLTSGFVYESAEEARARFAGESEGFVYSRYGNPTVATFEQRLAAIDGMEACFATASGMSAVFAALACQLSAGDHLVAARAMFGSCHHIVTQILPRWGIETTLVDGTDLDAWAAAIRPGATKAVFFETPSNPTLELIDIAAVAEIAHQAGARVVVDNVFSTPVLQRPGEFGADVVVYSGTKHIDGQGRCLGGAVLSSARFRNEVLQPFMRHTGPALSPFNAWVLLKGLETLDLRVEAQCRSAARLAAFLETRREVARAIYPGLASYPQRALAETQMTAGGTILAFELAGGGEAAFATLNGLRCIDISNNLGDAKSLITHPATTTHRAIAPEERARIGVSDGLVRLSVGLEDVEDLEADLAQALEGMAQDCAA
ncbi:MAG: O-succinylhomoserine sulfhydrylase [Rhodospirillaceae bacterium]|nr:O-succinylhomoserine sulfhydrylase [Rhodospirillaceae bacterium]